MEEMEEFNSKQGIYYRDKEGSNCDECGNIIWTPIYHFQNKRLCSFHLQQKGVGVFHITLKSE